VGAGWAGPKANFERGKLPARTSGYPSISTKEIAQRKRKFAPSARVGGWVDDGRANPTPISDAKEGCGWFGAKSTKAR